ncbi:MAG: hypothetical protein BAJATHORv1_30285 [Candidatus Thorarchaeota archaeon]|nr:MAG: hypothetical protein BAJATHORv1_30285 [Candidatus Thorarchaeota archaeon]
MPMKTLTVIRADYKMSRAEMHLLILYSNEMQQIQLLDLCCHRVSSM